MSGRVGLVAAALLVGLCAGCGAVRLEDEVWHERVEQIATEREVAARDGAVDAGAAGGAATDGSEAVGGGHAGPAEVVDGDYLAPDHLEPAALAGRLRTRSRAVFEIVRSGADGDRRRWRADIVAPGARFVSADGKTFDATLKSGKATLTVSGTEESSGRIEEAEGYVGEFVVRGFEGDAVSEPERSMAMLALGFLRGSQFEACRILAGRGEVTPSELDHDESVQISRAWSGLFCMSQIASKNETVRGLLFEVVQLPSWWTWLTFRIKVSFGPAYHEAVAVETPFGPGYRFPLALSINGDPAFYASLTVVEPAGVLEMVGGVVAADGFAPHRPDEKVSLRLVGASLRRDEEGEPGGHPIEAGVEVRPLGGDGGDGE